jgi:hypothetical protein
MEFRGIWELRISLLEMKAAGEDIEELPGQSQN